MTDAILTLNAGSSSLKFALFDDAGDNALLRGSITGLGTSEPSMKLKGADGAKLDGGPVDATDAGGALVSALAAIQRHADGFEVCAVGHRVVHGGVEFDGPVALTDEVIEALAALTPFAPLHQPHNLAGVAAAREAFPDARQVGCFDTAFHRSHPWVNDTFALPSELYDAGVRRFGFHGLSYEYICERMRTVAPFHLEGGAVVAHLGNGASMCAIRGGHSVGSTMGFSALDGLPMGTRCGQLDPGVVLYLMDQMGMDAAAIEHMLYRESGLLGLSGLSSDMRVLLASSDPRAAAAIDYFV
ncbi:acetate kinase, partial [Rhizobiaceae bacterium]|nr:acetate kinase [Rhizobiaceae bacterium]